MLKALITDCSVAKAEFVQALSLRIRNRLALTLAKRLPDFLFDNIHLGYGRLCRPIHYEELIDGLAAFVIFEPTFTNIEVQQPR
jgi:hypothetical protein